MPLIRPRTHRTSGKEKPEKARKDAPQATADATSDLGWIFPEGPYRKSVVGRLDLPDGSERSLRCGFDQDKGLWHNRLGDYCPSDYELVYVLQGQAQLRAADGVTYEVEPGTLVQRFPGVRANLHYPDAQAQVVTCFLVLPRELYALLVRTGLSSPEPVIACGIQRAPIERLKRLYVEIRCAGGAQMPELMTRVMEGVVYLLRTLLHPPQVREGRALFDKVCRLLEQDLDRAQPLQEVARRAGVPYRQMRALFSRFSAVSPGQYRLNRRIEVAKDLLFGEEPLKEIARRLGYPDVYSFTKQFTQTTGSPPGRYRQQLHRTR